MYVIKLQTKENAYYFEQFTQLKDVPMYLFEQKKYSST